MQDIRDKFNVLRESVAEMAKADPPPGGVPLVMATIDLLEIFMLDIREIASNTEAISRNLPNE
jgi:hypothetical protein